MTDGRFRLINVLKKWTAEWLMEDLGHKYLKKKWTAEWLLEDLGHKYF